MLYLIEKPLDNYLYDILRTKLQLGDFIRSKVDSIQNIYGYFIIV